MPHLTADYVPTAVGRKRITATAIAGLALAFMLIVAAPAAAVTWNVTWKQDQGVPEQTWYSWKSSLNYKGAMTETASDATAYSDINGVVASGAGTVVQTFPSQPVTHRCKWGYMGYGYTFLTCRVGV